MNTYYKAAIRNQKELMPGIWKMELVGIYPVRQSAEKRLPDIGEIQKIILFFAYLRMFLRL